MRRSAYVANVVAGLIYTSQHSTISGWYTMESVYRNHCLRQPPLCYGRYGRSHLYTRQPGNEANYRQVQLYFFLCNTHVNSFPTEQGTARFLPSKIFPSKCNARTRQYDMHASCRQMCTCNTAKAIKPTTNQYSKWEWPGNEEQAGTGLTLIGIGLRSQQLAVC